VLGTYSAILVVNDGKADSQASVVTITATNENKKPVARAGDAQYVSLKATPTPVTLDGTDSSDPDKDFISFRWVLITRPSGSNALLTNSTTPKPTFTPDVAGTYVASLIVNDGKLDSEAAAATITVSAKNSEPVANAGTPQNVKLGLVTLDGTNSKDDDSDPLGFMWVLVSKPANSNAELLLATSPKPTFQADVVGTYVATLVVTDNKLAKSSPATTTITASIDNRPPTASAGLSRNEVLGVITLDGSKSLDLDGNPLTYKWSLLAKPEKSSAALSSATEAMPKFTADLAGIYVFGLVVNDGKVDSAPVTISITASSANQAPTAVPGDPKNAITGTLVTLDGSKSSDPNPGDTLKYKWAIVNRPAGSVSPLIGDTTAMPTFTADASGVYLISLIVSDGKLESSVVTTTVTAANANLPPSANAGLAQSAAVGAEVTLDGSASSDPNGDRLSYQWVLVARPLGSNATLVEPTSPKPKFTADQSGIYIASLVVSDGAASSTLVTTTVSASIANRPPVANAGTNQNVVTGSLVSVSAAGSSDPDGDRLSYNWAIVSQPSGTPLVSLGDASTSVNPTFTAIRSGTYVLSLQVSDNRLTSAYSYITITAGAANLAPTAVVNPIAPVTVGTLVTLDASNSTDPNGDVLLYRWVLTYRPANSNASLDLNTLARPKFTADQPGVYVATLVVNDGRLDSQQVTVAVTASP
jgi:hypothetical protein